jgi:hypothetical protein
MAITKVTTGTIEDGTIVNADVNASAAIASTKLSGVESGLTSVQTFTSSGTWTRPSGITKVMVEVQGAGGGGCKGSSYHTAGAGGGYARKFLDVSSISTSTITIGTGGAGSASGVTANGGDGGLSKWADGTNTITGNGGAGGTDANTYSAGGTGVGGDFNITGQSGGANTHVSGDSFLGKAGIPPNSADAPSAAKSGSGYGGGGSAWTGYSIACGSGSDGIVIVTEYK